MSSGIYVGITCKKQGNYKEGQLVIGVIDGFFDKIIAKTAQEIKYINKHEYLNFSDLDVLTINSKLKK